MRSGEFILLGFLLLSYLMVESNIKDLQKIGFFSFVTSLSLYIINITFRYSYTAWFDLRRERHMEKESQRKIDQLMSLREDAIMSLEKKELLKNTRTTERLQAKKRSSINISA